MRMVAANRSKMKTTPHYALGCFCLLLSLAVCGSGAASEVDADQRLFGPDVTTWQRPAPLMVAAFASPRKKVAPEGSEQPTEGQRFLQTLTVEEREILQKDRIFLLQQEDPDSPSRRGTGSAPVKGFIRAVAIFDQPKERVIELMFEPGNQDLFLSDLDRAEPVARKTDVGELTRFSIDFWFWDIDFWIQHWFYPEWSRVEWFLDTDHFDSDIDGNTGYWQVYALSDTQSVGEYGITVDTGIPFPRRWMERIQRRRIPGAMKQFLRYINSNGTYRKD